MIKKLFTISMFASLLSGFYTPVNAQEIKTHCSTHSLTNAILANDPEARKRNEELEAFTKRFIADRQASASKKMQVDTIIIPVVVHILHKGGSENISDAQVHDAIRIANRDHQMKNADTASIIAMFKDRVAGNAIKFVLANIDPNGNCTNGILRHFTDITNSGDDVQVKSFAWNTSKYFNMYTVVNAGGAGGYSFLPGSFPNGHPRDGIVCLYTQFGGIGTSNGNLAERTITHEIGHYLNLMHTWGGSNTPGSQTNCTTFPSGDLVDDTPQTPGVGTQNCNTTMGGCKVGETANVQNYMDYASCEMMFTEGQATRMLAALNSTVGGRNGLWKQENLLATGTESGHVRNTCLPIADFFTTDSLGVCTGATISFKQMMTNDHKDSVTYLWEFEGGSPATSSAQNPVITYNTPGKFGVQLIVSNKVGSDTISRANYIHAREAIAEIFPEFSEGFESADFNNPGWIIQNPSGTVKWERSTEAGYNSSASLFIKNFKGNPFGSEDAFILPALNFSTAGSGKIWLKFNLAYAKRNNSSNDDRLTIYISRDCGNSFLRTSYNKDGDGLSTTENSSTEFTPTSSNQWRKDSLDITTFNKGKKNILIKFVNTSGFGNNLYLDNINLGGDFPLGIDAVIQDNLNFNVYPNPFTESAKLNFFLISNSKVKIQILDIMGREMKTLINDKMDFGSHDISFNAADIGVSAKGVYFVKLEVNGIAQVRKLILN